MTLHSIRQRLSELARSKRWLAVRARLETVLLSCEVDKPRQIRRCALAAFLLVAACYADVIFLRASVSTANLLNVTMGPRGERVQLYPERAGREAYQGYFDLGGPAYQSEPSAQFMARTIWSGQSVFWNPYSATGSLGVETLVDVKTSPLTMVVALAGGSDKAFHLAFLGFSWLGTFCLMVLFAVRWRLSLAAALAGGVTYLLNGYNVANLVSNFSQTWFYFPVLMLALASFAERPRALGLLGITAGAGLFLSTTFLPTTIVLLGTTLFVGAVSAFAVAATTQTGWRGVMTTGARRIAGQIAGVALAFLVLAVVWAPIAEAMRLMDTASYYAARNFFPAYLFNLASLFSPKHAFEAYNAASAKSLELRGNVAFHQGIVGALIVTQVVRGWPMFPRVLVAAVGAALVLLIARVYGVPGYAQFVDHLPLIGNFGQQYLWIAISALFTLLVGFGTHALLAGGVRKIPLYAGALVIVAAITYAAALHGVRGVAYFYLSVAALVIAGAVVIMTAAPAKLARVSAAILVVLLSWAELTFYVDHVRYTRTERFAEPPPFVRFLQAQPGLHRIASYGWWGIPPEYGGAYGLYQIDSMNFNLMPRYVSLFNRLILPNPRDQWSGFITLTRAPDTDRLNLAAFDMVGTRFLIVPATYEKLRAFMSASPWKVAYQDAYFVIFENPTPLPRAFVVDRLVEGKETPLDLGLSPREVAVSSDPALLTAARALGITDRAGETAAPAGSVTITRYDHARVDITAELDRPGVLVLTDAWYPNWSVRVDGEARPLGIVDEAFRGVALPAGRHLVEMTYAPRTLWIGQALTLLGLAVVVALLVGRRRLDPVLARLFGDERHSPAERAPARRVRTAALDHRAGTGV